jgi:hypothetical protein
VVGVSMRQVGGRLTAVGLTVTDAEALQVLPLLPVSSVNVIVPVRVTGWEPLFTNIEPA